MQAIADYEFVGWLGSGNHGQCFLAARPPRLPIAADFVAVKVLYAESTAETFRRATRELKSVAAVASPYLVELYDAGQHDGVFYYAMAYRSGGTLAGPLVPIDQTTALRAVADAAWAVAALHAMNLSHGGVKPSNILLDGNGTTLADVALAEIFTPGVTLTGAGPVTSIEYTDPAVLRGEPLAPHHDVWSLAATLYRVAAGTGIYGELPANDGVLALRTLLSTEPDLSALAPPLADVVADCLGAPGSRPGAAAVAERITAAIG
jgi:eukaryotic-like serine/threonine-protein kinase